jgi:hypothetical protein
MTTYCEAVIGGQRGQPALEVAVAELDDAMALATDEVVMMPLTAKAVADLAGPMHQRVDNPLLAEQGKGAVDGGEADRFAARDQASVDLLGGRVVRLASE